VSDLEAVLKQASMEDLLAELEVRTGSTVQTTFSNKSKATKLALQVRPRVMHPVKKNSIGSPEDQRKNLLIEGDNLQALVTLYKERGQVDLILTDPPYNTGNDFRYNDKWDEDPNDQGIGEFVSEDDGAKHTKWMRFMYPRLRLMKEMLRPTGVLAICIDHRELFHLGQMLDEIFDEENRLAIINWEKTYSPKSHDDHISSATEYVLVYAKDKTRTETGLFERSETTLARYSNPDDDLDGDWKPGDAMAMGASTHAGQVYGIQSPFTGNLEYPTSESCWRSERKKMKAWLQEWGSTYEDLVLEDGRPSPALVLKGWRPDNSPAVNEAIVARAEEAALKRQQMGSWPRLIFLKKGYGRPALKRHIKAAKKGIVPTTYWARDLHELPEMLGSTSWNHEESGHSQSGVTELTALVGKGHGFSTVKPLKLMQKIIQLWCPHAGLVVDPFAGSGTTAHAVLKLNAEAGADRRFIMIEQGRPERGDSYAQTLTVSRLKAAITGIWANDKGYPLGGGYSFMKLEKKVDGPALLRMERAEMTDVVVFSHMSDGRQRGIGLQPIEGKKYLVAANAQNEGFYLIWEGSEAANDFTEDEYETCVEEGESLGLSPVYHVYARRELFQRSGVHYYQIPNRILADFGLDVRSEPFASEEN
jgi:adenine-specific DNA-methyltransferase